MRPAEPGRRALLNAGRTLLAGSDLTRLSVSAVTTTAEMAKGSFYQHWRSREDYIRALHEAFHDELFDKVQQQLAGRPPGAERLATGLAAYLDGCLAEPATKALLVQARTEAGLGEQVGRRNEQAAQVLTADLAAVGWDHPEPLAVLLVAAIAETALIELTDGRPRDDLREAILRLATPARD